MPIDAGCEAQKFPTGTYPLLFCLLVNANKVNAATPAFTWGFAGGREGGVRGISFVSGGFLPEKQRGTHLDEYIHVCDWLSTFS